MAVSATKATGVINVAATATEIAAANADRVAIAVRVLPGAPVFIGNADVTVDDGYYLAAEDGPLSDQSTTDAWYAIARSGTTPAVSFIEITDTSS
jgi:hypothetical protein